MRRLFLLLVIPFLFSACSKIIYPKTYKNTVRILAIGNSYSQDALAYVPFVLRNMDVDVDVRIGILMKSSSALSDHVSNFEKEVAEYSFFYYGGKSSWSSQGLRTIQWALTQFEWDIILTHQSSSTLEDWASKYEPYLSRFVEGVQSVINYPVKYAWMVSQVRPARTNGGVNWDEEAMISRFKCTIANANRVIDETPFEIIIPVGTAVQNARTISTLKRIGDYAENENNTSGNGYLCAYDGVHLQEGLPCQLAAYAVIIPILNIYGIDETTIYKDDTRITKEWLSEKSVPGPHGIPLGSTDLNCELARKCAIAANDNPYSVTTILSN